MGLADRLFAWNEEAEERGDAAAEADMMQFLRDRDVPFDRIGWDHYDGSLELYGVPADWRMHAELQRELYREGFIKAYVNHSNDPDRWETHYSFGTVDGFKAQPGWRVSYPHKRNDGDKRTWFGAKPVPLLQRLKHFVFG